VRVVGESFLVSLLLCTHDEDITDKLSTRDHISEAIRLKSPQNIHKKHIHLKIIEELYWDYMYSLVCIVRPCIGYNGLQELIG
jgi:hypothetical protein